MPLQLRHYRPFETSIDGHEVTFRIKSMSDAEILKHAKLLRTLVQAEAQAESLATQDKNPAEIAAAQELGQRAGLEFIRFLYEELITIEPGCVVDEDGTSVTSGADFFDCYVARMDIHQLLIAAVREKNEMSEHQKKVSPSPIASTPISSERQDTRRGGGRERIAEPAASSDSKPTEDAKPDDGIPSGSMDLLSCDIAPSSN